MKAAWNGKDTIASLLIEKGKADVEAKDKWGESIISYHIIETNYKLLLYLAMNYTTTPLH